MAHLDYEKLKSASHIRLLKIGPGQADDDLCANIFQISLLEKPHYIAISYVWGDPSPTNKIRCGKETFGITSSLHFALKRVRHKQHPVVVWADAICINQSDNYERASQVRLMKDIYEQAVHVAAVLGDAADNSHLVPGLMEAIFWEPLNDISGRIPLDGFSARCIPDLDDPAWAASRAFFRRPWWTRVWIVQEFVVARDIQVICGDWKMRWEYFEIAIRNSKKHHTYHIYNNPDSGEPDPTSPDVLTGYSLVMTRLAYMRGERWSLLVLLQLFGAFHSTKARDRLFALLGIADDANASDLDPDYDSSLETIFVRYAAYYIQRYQSIALLYDAGTDKLPGRFPSWVPDWTRFRRRLAGEDPSTHTPLYYAGGRGPAQIRFTHNLRALILTGCFVDTVIKAGKDHKAGPGEKRGRTGRPLTGRMQDSDEMVASLVHYPTGEHISEVYWRTLIANRVDGKIPDSSIKTSYEAFRGVLRAMERTLDDSEHAEAVRLRNAAQPFIGPLFALYPNMVFCVTRKGMMGLVPLNTKCGDLIAVFSGCALPCILRTCSDNTSTYFLVGACYIHGIMSGQALRSDGWVTQDISIR